MAVTIRDVASEANVSATTVSRVFNHTDLVSPETVERVRRIAQEMGYEPNATAKSLSHGRTDAIGVVLPAPHGEFFSEVMRGIDEVAQSSNFHLLISSSHYSPEEADAAMKALSGRVDGLLVMSTHVSAGEMLRNRRLNVPAVFMNSAGVGDAYDAYDIENREGARQVVGHLIDRGYDRLAVITGPLNSHDVQERLTGARQALEEAGRDPDDLQEVRGDFTQASGYDAGKEILQLDPRPDAVFACNDYMAIGALAAFQEAGVSTPSDIAIAGFDDIPSARYASPPLTTVRVPAFDLGRRAARRLLDRLATRQATRQSPGSSTPEPADRMLASELVVRASS
jgi:LacI family transcriptional regulator